MPLPEFNTHAIGKFLELARQGRFNAASSGEKVAHKLAKCLAEIGDDMALLDASAIDGFYLLAQQAHGPWPTDEYKNLVFGHINRAAA